MKFWMTFICTICITYIIYGQSLYVSTLHTARSQESNNLIWNFSYGRHEQERIHTYYNWAGAIKETRFNSIRFHELNVLFGIEGNSDLSIHYSRHWEKENYLFSFGVLFFTYHYQWLSALNEKLFSNIGISAGVMGDQLSIGIPLLISYHPTEEISLFINPKYMKWDEDYFFGPFMGRMLGTTLGIRYGKRIGLLLKATYTFNFEKSHIYYEHVQFDNFFEWSIGLSKVIHKN